MSTQNLALTVNNNPASSRENMRRLIALDVKRNPALKFYGDRDDPNSHHRMINDHHVPTVIDADELDGINDDDDVGTSTVVPRQTTNFISDYVREAKVKFSVGGPAVPGNLGDIGVQEIKLMYRAMNALNTVLISNIPSRRGTDGDNGIAYRTGSPVTFFGNGDVDPTTNYGLKSVATTVADLNAGGGYTASTEVTAAIDDRTPEGTRGTIQLNDIIDAAGQIYEELDSAGVDNTDVDYVAFVPVTQFNRLMDADNNGILGQNEYMHTMIGGKKTEIQSYIYVINSAYGKITCMPVTNQISPSGSNRKMTIVTTANATRICFKNRPMTELLKYSRTQRTSVVQMSFSVDAPESRQGVAIVGARQ